MYHAAFPCPLCRDAGRIVVLEAELEPEPLLVTVTDLQGGCEHAASMTSITGSTRCAAWRRGIAGRVFTRCLQAVGSVMERDHARLGARAGSMPGQS